MRNLKSCYVTFIRETVVREYQLPELLFVVVMTSTPRIAHFLLVSDRMGRHDLVAPDLPYDYISPLRTAVQFSPTHWLVLLDRQNRFGPMIYLVFRLSGLVIFRACWKYFSGLTGFAMNLAKSAKKTSIKKQSNEPTMPRWFFKAKLGLFYPLF